MWRSGSRRRPVSCNERRPAGGGWAGPARPPVYCAAWSIATGQPALGRDASFAKASANEPAGLAARVALQCHGAIGYTYEHDLHLWLKRVWSLQRAWGDTATHRQAVATALLG